MSLVLRLWSLWPLISRTGQGGAPTAYISWLKSFATAEETLICIPLKWSFPNILNICKHDRNHYSVFSYCSIMGILKKDLSVWPLFCPATALRFHTMSPCQYDQLCNRSNVSWVTVVSVKPTMFYWTDCAVTYEYLLWVSVVLWPERVSWKQELCDIWHWSCLGAYRLPALPSLPWIGISASAAFTTYVR